MEESPALDRRRLYFIGLNRTVFPSASLVAM
jgi:hypothetical protein